MPQNGPLIALLGSPALIAGDESRPLQMSEKTLALLALLVCHAERPLSRTALASMLWPDVDEAEARANLRRHLYKLAKTLPAAHGEPLILTKNTAQWNSRAGCRVDVIDFTDALGRSDFEDALRAYGGPLCIGLFDDALLEQRERLERSYVDLLREQIRNAKAGNDHAKRIAALERLTAHDPLDEPWVRELAQARLDASDRAGARRELVGLVSRLRSELGVEPDESTMHLLSECLEGSRTGAAGNLPVETTSMVGRDAALGDLANRLRSANWITIAGPAGIGKTRLAVHLARNHRSQFEDGAWFVDLSSVVTWNDAVHRIAATLSVTIESALPQEHLRRYLSRRRVLLVLDNLEQLDEAAADGIAGLVRESSTNVLATSRRRIGGAGENVYALDQLALPPEAASPAQALQYSAVRLFVERAVSVAPSFAVSHENVAHVTSIARRLDGLPLAIELVAARANLLTMEGMAKRVHDLDAFRHKGRSDRHQTVTAAIRWSYELLASRERLLLQRLAVFEGPFDLAAIEAVCSGDDALPESAVFPVLSELVEASLVSAVMSESGDEQRYALLETVRAFLRALPDARAGELRAAHAAYFAQRAGAAEIAYERSGTSEYVAMLRRDEANMEAALAYAWETGDASLLGRFVSSFARLWPPAEMKRRDALFEYLAREGIVDSQTPEFRARVLTALGAYASTSADWEACKRFRIHAASCWREAGDEAQALSLEAMIALVDNYLGASLQEATMPELYRIVDRLRAISAHPWYASIVEMNLAAMELSLGNTERALPLALSALSSARREKRTNYIASNLATLAKLYLAQNDVALAERCIEEAIEITEDPSYAVLRAQAFGDRARLRLASGDAAAALRACARSLETYERAFELRYVTRTLTVAMEALLALGQPHRAAHIAGYVLAAARSTGTVALAAGFEASSAYRRTREVLRDGFAAAAQLGATFTYHDLYGEVAGASSPEDDSRTIPSL